MATRAKRQRNRRPRRRGNTVPSAVRAEIARNVDIANGFLSRMGPVEEYINQGKLKEAAEVLIEIESDVSQWFWGTSPGAPERITMCVSGRLLELQDRIDSLADAEE